MTLKRAVTFPFTLAILVGCLTVLPLGAHAPSGAIFTTTADGSEVNANIYANKSDVYLDGGPGPGAPSTAAGLDEGDYYFQVTDPSGKTLLSQDPIECRSFHVNSEGVIDEYTGGCAHATGTDQDHGGVTIGLMPFANTPNRGGVYKVWVTFVEDYTPGAGKHGFVPSHSKTDNFKVREGVIREIDTLFINRANGQLLSGLGETWIDTLGASNRKWSYFVSFWNITEAHIEAVEDGDHYIVLENQPGCTVGEVFLRHDEKQSGNTTETFIGNGPQTVQVKVSNPHAQNWFVKVYCDTASTAPPPTGSSSTITFNDRSGNQVLNGEYPTGVVEWGTNAWYLSGPWGGFTTNSISFNGSGMTSASFRFISPKTLTSLEAYNGGANSTISISCSGNPTATATVGANQLMTINTGWTNSCSTVTIASSNGWFTNFDNLQYR
jgi:hypothetical protein